MKKYRFFVRKSKTSIVYNSKNYSFSIVLNSIKNRLDFQKVEICHVIGTI